MQPSYCYNVAQRFARTAAAHSERLAISFDGLPITYHQLDVVSDQLARFLLAKGVQKRDCVCIALEKTLAAYALIVACWKTGATYFSVDPRNPRERLQKILVQCSPKLVFAHPGFGMAGYDDRIVFCERAPDNVSICKEYAAGPLSLPYDIDGSDPVYVMFTSGSTGTPKGATISNSNLLWFISWAQSQYELSPHDIITNLNPLYFDNSVFDIFSSLFSGATLVPFGAGVMLDPHAIVERIHREGCSVFFSVPSLLMYLQTMKVAKREYLGSLRKIIFGGEGYPKVKLKPLFDELGDQAEFYNVYGPTECTCICSSYRVTQKDFEALDGFPPLGSLIVNFRGYVLDDEQAVETGGVGELCLGGPCVGLGYYNQPEQTAKVFVQNPLNSSFHERLYRTGDLVRVNPADGQLYFVSRKDLQIKHQGYRIELEEIQHALVAIDGIDEAVALHAVKDNISSIVAVVATEGKLTAAEIKSKVAEKIPRYMIPEKVHILERMPKNPNGKTDRPLLKQTYAS